MMSKFEAGKKIGEGSGSGKLLNEIEAISKALYLDKNPPKSLYTRPNSLSKASGKTLLPESKSKTKNVKEDPSQKDQKDKKSFWNWKPLKALSHIRNKRFNCSFQLHVHSIEELPPNFNDVSLCVHWKRRDGVVVTRPSKVYQGMVEFEEKLTHVCSVYGSRNGPHHSAKYEAKHFLLYASVFGAVELDLGKHRVDLTRLLPLTLEELEEEKSSGTWTTSFKLSGEGKGATMHVSFGYSVIRDNPTSSAHDRNVPEVMNLKQSNMSSVKSVTKLGQSDGRSSIRRGGSLPGNLHQRSRASSRSVEDIKVLHEVLPTSKLELSSSVNLLYQKFDEETLDIAVDYKPELDVFTENLEPLKLDSYSLPDSGKENVEKESEDNEFSVIEHGIEFPSKEQMKSDDVIIKAIDDSSVDHIDLVETNGGVGVVLEDDAKLHPRDEENSKSTDEHIGVGVALEDDSRLHPQDEEYSKSTDEHSGVGVALEDDSRFHPQDEGYSKSTDELVVYDFCSKEDDMCTKESLMKDLESALNSMTNLETAGLDSPEEEEDYTDVNSDFEASRKAKSLSLDDATESVANEFLDMLGIEHSSFGLSSESEPESPRERLLRQFEKDALSGGFSLFDFDNSEGDQAEFGDSSATASEWGHFFDDVGFPSLAEAVEDVHPVDMQAAKSKTRATILEDLETESLMQEWGLNEKSFQCSPPGSSGGFGSPIDLPHEDSLQLPPLGEALGPFLQTKNGGFLRSMNPALFSTAKSGGSLIMQVSSPVVVPAEMGSGIMEILQGLASVGIEKLSMQANKLMPLEDITGKTMQQIAWEAEAEAAPRLEVSKRQYLSHHETEVGQDTTAIQRKVKGRSFAPRSSNLDSSPIGNEMGSEYVSLEDLAPLAMDKIEALSMEGLRIQSGMSDEDAPSNFNAQSIGDISALKGKGVNISGSLGLEGTAGLQLMDIKDNGDNVDGLMGLSLTLDEWMRMDSGDFDDDDGQISERTSKILAAHHANSLDMIRGSKGEKRRGKGSNRKGGLLGNNFTVALMVQLRDPLRNYEPVGTPMLTLIQVERVFVPPKPKIYSTVSELRRNNEAVDDSKSVVKKEIKVETKEESSEPEGIPQFKITEVHVAGLKTDPGKKKLWGTKTQQQSGSRWLVANGMGKSNKHPFMKSKGVSKSNAPMTTTAQPGDTLWSISSRIHGTGSKWKELAALNPHVRNPNVILPNETIRLC